MNESTLVTSEEMSDLDWMARNVHKWSDNCDLVAYKWCGYAHFAFQNQPTPSGCGRFTKYQWLARRSELQNKPSWKDAPEWANWLAQDEDGEWWFFSAKPKAQSVSFDDRCSGIQADYAKKGETLGDWRDTLEKRPTDLSEQAVMSRLKEATDNVLASVPEIMAEKYKIEPFVSMEDAATAKQNDPVNSPSHYASGGIECIDAIKSSMSREAFLGYLKGNVQKYMWRYEKKVNPSEDLKKARWHLDRLIEEQK